MVVDDEIAIPHAKPGKYVNSFGITISTFKTPIVFASHKNVRILITIASVSSENHIDLITQIMKLIEDESFMELLLNSNDSQKDYILKRIHN
ncbi:PTS sugar transporter subunit IIA [Clostridium mucosae]|uniref:PTS sugar transporter subunit IIA n=1 Tax=Clostridium sp. DSM 100503 TaxID=2963282 RepID=UPI0035BBFF74